MSSASNVVSILCPQKHVFFCSFTVHKTNPCFSCLHYISFLFHVFKNLTRPCCFLLHCLHSMSHCLHSMSFLHSLHFMSFLHTVSIPCLSFTPSSFHVFPSHRLHSMSFLHSLHSMSFLHTVSIPCLFFTPSPFHVTLPPLYVLQKPVPVTISELLKQSYEMYGFISIDTIEKMRNSARLVVGQVTMVIEDVDNGCDVMGGGESTRDYKHVTLSYSTTKLPCLLIRAHFPKYIICIGINWALIYFTEHIYMYMKPYIYKFLPQENLFMVCI